MRRDKKSLQLVLDDSRGIPSILPCKIHQSHFRFLIAFTKKVVRNTAILWNPSLSVGALSLPILYDGNLDDGRRRNSYLCKSDRSAFSKLSIDRLFALMLDRATGCQSGYDESYINCPLETQVRTAVATMHRTVVVLYLDGSQMLSLAL